MVNKQTNKNNEVEVTLSKERKIVILDELFEDGVTTKKIELIPGKKKVTIKNLSVEDQLEIENELSQLKGNSAYIVHKYTHMILQRILSGYTLDEAKLFLDKLPTALMDKLLGEWKLFEKEIQAALGVDVISENFSPGVAPVQNSEQSQEESTSEKKEV